MGVNENVSVSITNCHFFRLKFIVIIAVCKLFYDDLADLIQHSRIFNIVFFILSISIVAIASEFRLEILSLSGHHSTTTVCNLWHFVRQIRASMETLIRNLGGYIA